MRYERKYKIEDLSLALTHQAIRSHPASFRKIFPDRQINNIYFDTPHISTYHENVKGIAQRKKFRVRWYGEEQNIQTPKLEVKIKDNQLGYKESTSIDSFSWNSLGKLQREINIKSNTGALLFPTLANAYRRAYYGTPDGHFRLTIDWHLRYFSLLGARRFTRYNIEDRGVVVELKYEAEQEENADRIRQFLPFRQTKSSKYVTGMNMTGMIV